VVTRPVIACFCLPSLLSFRGYTAHKTSPQAAKAYEAAIGHPNTLEDGKFSLSCNDTSEHRVKKVQNPNHPNY